MLARTGPLKFYLFVDTFLVVNFLLGEQDMYAQYFGKKNHNQASKIRTSQAKRLNEDGEDKSWSHNGEAMEQQQAMKKQWSNLKDDDVLEMCWLTGEFGVGGCDLGDHWRTQPRRVIDQASLSPKSPIYFGESFGDHHDFESTTQWCKSKIESQTLTFMLPLAVSTDHPVDQMENFVIFCK